MNEEARRRYCSQEKMMAEMMKELAEIKRKNK